MVGEAEAEAAFFGRGRSNSLISQSFPTDMTESRECITTTGGIMKGDQEATSMGDILCDIFTSQLSQGTTAATCAQDLFGILDFLEVPQEASKFMSLIEESSSTYNNNNNREAENGLVQIPQLKLPILEQEPELEPYSSNSFSLSNADQGTSEPLHTKHMPHKPLYSVASELSSRCRLKSEICESLLQKSKSFQAKGEMNPIQLSEFSDSETDTTDNPKHKRLKTVTSEEGGADGQRMTHIAVERNRRKQMNEHLAVLRSLMPGFYVQRGDQASIIGGVIEFIKELQQLLQSLESKKQRKAYAEVLSPLPCSSPRPAALSPRSLALPISPRTPQPSNASYRLRVQPPFMDPNFETAKELVANSTSSVADVEVKIVGSNALLKTLSPNMPGHILKLVETLENLSLEILHLNISTIDNTVLNSFTLKIGIECKLSVEELAQAVQQTFSC
ncbi:hypothetical protein SUGI_0749120 [Cryptomeria japonica]|uniref:transcription factor SPEECHLESS n=1 Tax=Cryptomeria japonica TaxID=3369 RepID=UPI002414AF8A|nr:transcription factor SPEECHLESS [Cryptomeria japonica]XP_057818102.2 transcription factor SPEECHLESS [Cryptomeria japonica]GLJ36989.1 hypothetical protein SUGI_0749120 [Cryptomeria japonica]